MQIVQTYLILVAYIANIMDSDCSHVSNLIRVRSFASMMNASHKVHLDICSRRKKQTTFSRQKHVGGIMVKFISLHALDYDHVQYLKNKKTTRSKMRITTLYTFCLYVC